MWYRKREDIDFYINNFMDMLTSVYFVTFLFMILTLKIITSSNV